MLIKVEPAALRDASAAIAASGRDLEVVPAVFGDRFGGLHSRDIEDALSDFASCWSQRRAELIESIHVASTTLRAMSECYEAADRDSAASVGNGASSLPSY